MPLTVIDQVHEKIMKAGKLPAFTLLYSLLRLFGQANMHGTERQLVALLDARFCCRCWILPLYRVRIGNGTIGD
jgi:hypothetical protein